MSFIAWSVELQLVPCSLPTSGWTAGRGGGRLRCSVDTRVSEAKQKMLASVTVVLKQILTTRRSLLHKSKFSLTSFICLHVRQNVACFSLTSLLVRKLACQFLNKDKFV